MDDPRIRKGAIHSHPDESVGGRVSSVSPACPVELGLTTDGCRMQHRAATWFGDFCQVSAALAANGRWSCAMGADEKISRAGELLSC